MPSNKKINIGGLMVVLAIIAILTIGGVTGLSVITWPGADPAAVNKERDTQLNMLSKSVARLSARAILDFEDPMERQFFLEKVVKDIKADFPEIKDIWVLDDKRSVVYSPKEDEIEKPYKAPSGITPDVGDKFSVQPLSATAAWVATPIISMKTIIGGIRMTVEVPAASQGGGAGKGLVLIAGLIAMVIGIVVPMIMISAKTKALAAVKTSPAAAGIDDSKLNALKAEEASISAKLGASRREIAQLDQLKSQQGNIEQQLEEMKKQQFEETYKLENIKKEAAEIADHIDKRKKILEANPLERQSALNAEDQELVKKIEAHKQEELKLAQKIELIRRKVVDLDRRIETRLKEEQEIAERIETRKREESTLNRRVGG